MIITVGRKRDNRTIRTAQEILVGIIAHLKLYSTMILTSERVVCHGILRSQTSISPLSVKEHITGKRLVGLISEMAYDILRLCVVGNIVCVADIECSVGILVIDIVRTRDVCIQPCMIFRIVKTDVVYA